MKRITSGTSIGPPSFTRSQSSSSYFNFSFRSHSGSNNTTTTTATVHGGVDADDDASGFLGKSNMTFSTAGTTFTTTSASSPSRRTSSADTIGSGMGTEFLMNLKHINDYYDDDDISSTCSSHSNNSSTRSDDNSSDEDSYDDDDDDDMYFNIRRKRSSDQRRLSKVPRLALESIVIDECLGTGTFCSVYDVSSIRKWNNNNNNSSRTNNNNNNTQQRRCSNSSINSVSSITTATSTSSVFQQSWHEEIPHQPYSSTYNYDSGKKQYDVNDDDNDNDGHQQQLFVLKRLNTKTLKNETRTRVAIRDLVKEATILCQLPKHESIITLHAVSDNLWEASREQNKKRYANHYDDDDNDDDDIDEKLIRRNNPGRCFIMLERLSESLKDRLKYWRKLDSGLADDISQRSLMSFFSSAPEESMTHHSQQCDRIISVGLGVADALAFLHRHRILYRDLKPANIGFNIRDDTVKLFDFGFSIRLLDVDDDERLLTRCIGTPRYMAPEVSSSRHYGYSADVYSFAILLWEIITLQKPFSTTTTITTPSASAVAAAQQSLPAHSDLKQPATPKNNNNNSSNNNTETLERLFDRVCKQNERPSLDSVSSLGICSLLSMSWQKDPSLRPKMEHVLEYLNRDEVYDVVEFPTSQRKSNNSSRSRSSSLIMPSSISTILSAFVSS